MRGMLTGTLAIAGLTLREAQRQRLWLLLVVAAGVLVAVIPSLQAVDVDARRKLAVATVTTTVGFVATLLGILLGAATVRRDIERRTGFLLFSKPLPRGAYLCGRWLGVGVALTICVAVLSAVGAGAIAWQLGELPRSWSTTAPSQRWQIANAAPVALPPDDRPVLLAGDPSRGAGEGVRVAFTDLPSGEPLTVLVRITVGGFALGSPVRQAEVAVSAEPGDGASAVLLPLASGSPYGEDLWEERASGPQRVYLRSRDPGRADLSQDYARFVLPAAAIGADGRCIVQLNRLSHSGRVRIDADGILVARRGGGFLGNLARAGLVELAPAGMLCAATLLVVCVARIGTALLAGLTLYFGGHALRFVQTGMQGRDASPFAERLFDLLARILPDAGRFPVETALAASRRVPWATVGDAWLYFGGYTLVFLCGAWVLLRRAEL